MSWLLLLHGLSTLSICLTVCYRRELFSMLPCSRYSPSCTTSLILLSGCLGGGGKHTCVCPAIWSEIQHSFSSVLGLVQPGWWLRFSSFLVFVPCCSWSVVQFFSVFRVGDYSSHRHLFCPAFIIYYLFILIF